MAVADRLAAQVKAFLDTIPAAAPYLAEWPAEGANRAIEPSTLPVVDRLAEAAAAPSALVLAKDFAAAAPSLAWRQTYSAADFGPAFLERYGWSELIGLRGPIPSKAIACGVLMLGPEIDYPAHAHEAEELYLPLAGTALWRRGDEAFVLRAPGAVIEHPSWVPHAMRTGAETLVALYVWRGGDLAAKSKIIG